MHAAMANVSEYTERTFRIKLPFVVISFAIAQGMSQGKDNQGPVASLKPLRKEKNPKKGLSL